MVDVMRLSEVTPGECYWKTRSPVAFCNRNLVVEIHMVDESARLSGA